MELPRLEPALTLARAALAAAPAGLLTDLDGTLAPIVPHPPDARALPGAAEALVRLASRLGVVAVVTGRAVAEARRILGTDEVLIVGNHGLEWLEPGATEAAAPVDAAAAEPAIQHALRAVPHEAGVTLEDKRLSATVHFRNAADPAAAERRIREALETAAVPGVALRPGRMSLELRPAAAGDKGTAVRALAGRHGLRGVVVLGDDVTDLDMFRAARDLRSAGVTAAVLGVGAGDEVPAAVAAEADALLPDPAAVVQLLRELSAD
ncbi:MAG TPA: trehalose-phosphatase [Candidatus Limnocylindria bacterium]|nr:trehalose-phosphatase [Candidatus Limnocylindria bacterium]